RLERLHVITFAGKFDFIFQVGGVIPAKSATPIPDALVRDKTMIEKAEDKLPAAFGKKDVLKDDKTMFDTGKDAPAPLPGFGKPKDMHQTVFDKVADAPAPLPSFGKPKVVPEPVVESKKEVPSVTPIVNKPKDEEQTIAAKAIEPALPSFQKKPDIKPPENIERTEVMRQTPTPAPVSKPRFSLVVGKLNKNFELKDGATTIGRTIGCDIIIDDVSMSRRHAVITVTEDKITIRDLGSSNGTSVDKKRIGAEVEINSSSDIRLGMVEVRIKKIV
ncbi:MAG TPA: FHA domain-containing protein, partial [candidate division Zixibacteria bacterium]|nr:FHA domain-containing protein [candidate division Zixibacteria bacterium]